MREVLIEVAVNGTQPEERAELFSVGGGKASLSALAAQFLFPNFHAP